MRDRRRGKERERRERGGEII